jgi:hypothetical protein
MMIVTPNEIEQVAWEGTLEQLGETFRGAGARPRVTLGEPVVWTAEALESQTGKKWTVPLGDQRYTLVRLAYTLHELEKGSHYTEAILTAYLRPFSGTGRAIAHDLYPQRVTAENAGKTSVTLKPDFKFASVIEFSPGEAGVEIDHHNVFPVIQAYGLGESNPYWKFENHSANPLIGCQSVYLVLAAPSDAGGVRLSTELTATVESRLGGLLRVRTPEEVRQNLTRVIK